MKEDGSFRLNLKYFEHTIGGKPLNKNFEQLIQRKKREPETPLTQDDMDIAMSIQTIIEMAMQRIVKYVVKTTKVQNLCLSGGVALNCVSNGKRCLITVF